MYKKHAHVAVEGCSAYLIEAEHCLQGHQKLHEQKDCGKDTGHLKEDIQTSISEKKHANDT
jgi:hypothetical protein